MMMPVRSSWERSTPEQLLPAIKYVRDSFETELWKYSQVTQALGYAALHSLEGEPMSLGQYGAQFVQYLKFLGSTVRREFDDLFWGATLPSRFRACHDVYQQLIQAQIRYRFKELLDVGLRNTRKLGKRQPVEWAKEHLEFLILDNQSISTRWTRSVCDKQKVSNGTSVEDLDELIFWKSWRAPKLIHMVPAGNTPYDAANVWTREDAARTQNLLEARTLRFCEFLRIGLEDLAGAAHLHLAQIEGPVKNTIHPSLELANQPNTAGVIPEPTDLIRRKAAIAKVRNPGTHTVLSTPEAALFFEVQPRTIGRWLSEGHLKSGARRGSITIDSIINFEKKRSRRRSRS